MKHSLSLINNRIFTPKSSQYLLLLLHRLIAAAGDEGFLLVERRREGTAKGVILDAIKRLFLGVKRNLFF